MNSFITALLTVIVSNPMDLQLTNSIVTEVFMGILNMYTYILYTSNVMFIIYLSDF